MAGLKMLSALDGIKADLDLAKAGLIFVGVGIPFALCAWEFASWYRLRDIPGPLFNALSIYPALKNVASGRGGMNTMEMMEKYGGTLLRIGPNEVVTSDFEFYRAASGVRSKFTKAPFYAAAKNLADQNSLFSETNDAAHKELKTKLAPGYSGRECNFEEGIDKITAQLVNLIDAKYISTSTDYRPIEFAHKAQYYALDVITEVGMGKAVGYVSNDEDMYNYVAINDEFLPKLIIMLTLPGFASLIHKWPLKYLLPKDKDLKGFGKLIWFAKKVVDEKFASDAKLGNDMLSVHMRNGVTYKETLAEVLSQFVAGSDSTATATRMAILFLITNPTAMEALRREIEDGVKAGTVSSPIQDSEAQKLPYLRAVVLETLRIHPPSTGAFFKVVPPEGVTVDGKYLPGGTQLGIDPLSVTRRMDVFGPDPHVFRPERWVEAQAEARTAGSEGSGRYRDMLTAADSVFGYGKFMCVGKTIAFMELNKVIVELVRRFDFVIANPVKPMDIIDAGFWVTTNFWLRISRRESPV